MSSDANRAVVERLYGPMNERRSDEMWELFAPDDL
jgi:hypothetical protein